MKIILRQDVQNLGKQGDVVMVADGFARNHLIPKGLAHRATPKAEREAERVREVRHLQDVKELEVAQEMAGRLAQAKLAISARASEEGHLYGSVSAVDIQRALSEQLHIDLDRNAIDLPQTLREVGEHSIGLSLHEAIPASVTVEIVAEG